MTRSSVDLPQPDGPMSDTNSPWAMVRSMAWRATVVSLIAAHEGLADALQADDGSRAGLGHEGWASRWLVIRG